MYYVQDFSNTANGAQITAYGEQGAHDHDKSNQFTVDIQSCLVTTGNWKVADIRQGKFQSGQSKSAMGKLFVWKNNKWVRG